MDLFRSVEMFIRVVETKSFSEAARSLFLSRSVVSEEISRLEARLGVRLLNRTTRRVGLTEAGELYYQKCIAAQGLMRDAQIEAATFQEKPVGELRVAVSATFGAKYVAPVVASFLKLHPDISVTMDFGDRFVDLVAEGYDVAVRSAALADSQLIARRLTPNRMVFCAAPDYCRRAGTPETPLDLAKHNVLQYNPKWAHFIEWLQNLPDDLRPSKIGGNLIAGNLEAVRQMTLAGLGIALLPTFLVSDDIQAERLGIVLAPWSYVPRNIYALFPHRQPLPAKTRAFIDHLTHHFSSTPHWDEPLFPSESGRKHDPDEAATELEFVEDAT